MTFHTKFRFIITSSPHMLTTRRDVVKFLESIINMKLNSIRKDELMGLAQQYGVSLTVKEAELICQELRGKNHNLFNPEERKKVMAKISNIVGQQRANQIEQLFLSLTGR